MDRCGNEGPLKRDLLDFLFPVEPGSLSDVSARSPLTFDTHYESMMRVLKSVHFRLRE